MEVINIHAAKTHLSRLVERVENGETIIIARAGKPVARLEPLGAVTHWQVEHAVGLSETVQPAFDHEMDRRAPDSVDPEPAAKRRLGFLKGQMSIPDDFNEMDREEIERLFNDDE